MQYAFVFGIQNNTSFHEHWLIVPQKFCCEFTNTAYINNFFLKCSLAVASVSCIFVAKTRDHTGRIEM